MQPLALIRRVAACALAAFVVSCGGGGGGNNPPAADPSAKATLGAAGGTLKSPDGQLTLTIPAGALGNDTEITITELAAANVPQRLKDLGADRVWQLGPDGQQFAMPAALKIELPAGNEVVLLLHSSAGKTALADGSQLVVGAAGRTLTGQLGHFSEVATVRARGFEMPTLIVEPRDLEVGDTTTSTFAIRKTASDFEAEVSCDWFPDLQVTTILEQTGASVNCFSGVSLFQGTVREVGGTVTYECVAKGTRTVSATFTIEAVAGILDTTRTLLEGELTLRREIDVICRDKGGPAAAVKVGTFPLPFGMSLPDGVTIVNDRFAGLTGDGPHVLIAGSNGAVAMDLVTGLSSMNQTPSGPDGALGANLLGVRPISRPNPGAGTPAALFGTTTGGSGSYLRNWDNTAQFWGLTQISPGSTFIDASNAGGGIVAEEMVTVSPARGLQFVGFDAAFGFFTSAFGVALSAGQLGGAPQTAALPSAAAGSPVLVGIPGLAGAAARVVVHLRGSAQNAVPLFTLGGPALGLMRCASQAFGGRIPCIVTGGDKAYLFRHDPADPTAVPPVEVLDVGAGALGVQFGTRADGGLAAVVSNFGAGTLNIVIFGSDGAVAANRSMPLPAGVTGSAHAAPFAHGGRNYVAGTGNGSGNYFTLEVTFD